MAKRNTGSTKGQQDPNEEQDTAQQDDQDTSQSGVDESNPDTDTPKLETSGSVEEGTEKTGGAKTTSRTSEKDATPNPVNSIPVRAWEEEASITDIEKAMRDNPGLRTPDASRRHLPPEEYPDGSDERKAEAKARKDIAKAVETLEKLEVPAASPLAYALKSAIRLLRA